MKLTYIYHSGFALEFTDFSIIIDYYKDSEENGFVYTDLLKREKPLYILSTHSHPDHFNPEVLKWKDTNRDVFYIFSKDIAKNIKTEESNIIYLDKLDAFSDTNLEIKAYGSTDIGISFWIKVGEKTIFHAGDLNNWHWNEEASVKEIKASELFYKNELDLLASEVKHLDLAMFPIDPRLGKDFMKGATQFIEAIQVNTLSPMHFSSNPHKIEEFTPIAKKNNCNFICWQYRGESIII